MSLNPAPDFAVNLSADTFADAATNLSQSSSEQSKVKPRSSRLSLAQVEMGKSYIVDQVAVPDSQSDWAQQLEDIGFIPGEPVAIMARGMLGGDPLVVRIGLSTFALRKAEAQCIRVLEVDSSHFSKQTPLHSNKATR
jgi:ferrous iron transport protein A